VPAAPENEQLTGPPSRTTSGRPWNGTVPPVTTGPSGCGWAGPCGSSGGPRRSPARAATGWSGHFEQPRTRRRRPGPPRCSGPACWRSSRATLPRPLPSCGRAKPCMSSWGTGTASPRRWSAWARPPWCKGAMRRRGRCLRRRWVKLGRRETSVAVATVQIGLCALEGGDQHEARSLVREGDYSWPASWTSGGGSCMGLMGRPCWPPERGAGRWPRPCWARPSCPARRAPHRSWVSARLESLA
jgi:hypothetical protein